MVRPRSIALTQVIEASDAKPARFAHLANNGLDQHDAAIGRRFLGAAIGQRRLAERDGALQRAHQLRREALHPRIGHAGKLVRQQLRRRQEVAEVVIDLRHRQTEGGEPALLMQHRHQIALHLGQFALGDADLVAAMARDDDPGRAFGVFVEADQTGGQAPHRPHEQIMQREIDQRRGQNRCQQRYPQQVAGEHVHRPAQRRLVDDRLDELRAAGRRPDHADGLVAGLEHHLERIDDGGPHRHRSHVDVMIDCRRQVGAGQQPALLTHLDGDRAGADAAEDFARQRIRHHAGGRRVQHQRGGVGRRQPVVQPVHPEIGDRGHIDQDFRDHHQRNGQQQQLAGQAEPARRQRPQVFGDRLFFAD